VFNVYKVREDFPALLTGIVYLDNAATALTPLQVIAEVSQFYEKFKANPLRSVHRLAKEAEELTARARRTIGNFIGAKESEIVFTKNTTEGLNVLAYGLKLGEGDVVTTIIEHHGNLLPWIRRCKLDGRKMRVVRPNPDTAFEVEFFEEKIDRNVSAVAITLVSNVTGVILPIKEIAKIAHDHGAVVLVDAAQAAPHMPLDVERMGIDALAFSGHKLGGPMGAGVLYVREDLQEEFEPLLLGGGIVEDVSLEDYKLLPFPLMLEAGTIPLGEILGMAKAVEYLSALGMENVLEHDRRLMRILHEEAREIEGVKIYGPSVEKKVGLFPFNVGNMSSHEVALLLDAGYRVAVRSGQHCAIPLVRDFLGLNGMVRASTFVYNTPEDIAVLLEALRSITKRATS